MRSSPVVTSVRFTPAPSIDVSLGLLGFVSFDVDGLRLDGLALRRTRAGRLDLRYPEIRRGSRGLAHAIVRPANEPVRKSIEAQILAALQAEEWIEP